MSLFPIDPGTPDTAGGKSWSAPNQMVTPRQLWEVNWNFLAGSLLVVLPLLAIAAYLYNHQTDQLGATLLKLANRMEQQEDWSEFTQRMKLYLRVSGDDYQATRRLADVYYEYGTTTDEFRSGSELYARCLKLMPAETPDQERFATSVRYLTILSLVNPTIALRKSNLFLAQQGSDLAEALTGNQDLIDLLRLRTIIAEKSPTNGRDQRDAFSRVQLIKDYELLIKTLGDAPDLSLKLAFLYRKQADAMDFHNPNEAKRLEEAADRLITQTVEKNPLNGDVLLGRFIYRVRYSNAKYLDTSDLRQVLEIDSQNAQALMRLAFFLSEGISDEDTVHSARTLQAARDLLERSLDELPEKSYAQVALVNLCSQLGDMEGAQKAIDQAAKEYSNSQMVQVCSTRLAIMRNDYKRAAAGIARIRARAGHTESDTGSPVNRKTRILVDRMIADLLEANLVLNTEPSISGKLKASKILKKIDYARLQSQKRSDVLEEIGKLFFRLSDWDSAADLFVRARMSGVVSLQAELLLAQAYEQMLKFEESLDVYQKLLQRSRTVKQASFIWFQIGMLSLRLQISDDTFEMRKEVEQASENLLRIAPDSEEAFVLEKSVQLINGITNPKKVVAELKDAESRFGSSPRFLLLCADYYRELHELKRQSDILARNPTVSGVDMQHEPSASKPVSPAKMGPEDFAEIRRLANRWPETNSDERVQLIQRWCQNAPESVAAWMALANLGTSLYRADVVTQAIESLQQIELEPGYYWRFADLRQELAKVEKRDLESAQLVQSKCESLAKAFPSDLEVARLAAICQETCGDPKRASLHYFRAVEIEPSHWAIDGYLRNLLHDRNWQEAQQFIQVIPEKQQILRGRLDLIVQVHLELKQYEAARKLVDLAIREQGQASAHTDYLAGLIEMRKLDRDSSIVAHRHLIQAAEQEPSNLNYWVALLHFELNHYPTLWTDAAVRTANRIRWLLQAHGQGVSAELVPLILAQTLFLRGRIADADAFYRKAVEINPSIVSDWIPKPILSLAATATAAPVNVEIALLAGDEHARTLAVLDSVWHGGQPATFPISSNDYRANAISSALSGDEQAAIADIEATLNSGQGDYLLLANLCDRTGSPEKAREYRRLCLGVATPLETTIKRIFDDSLKMKDFELAKECMQRLKEHDYSPVARISLDAQLEIANNQLPLDLDAWVRKWQEQLTTDQQKNEFQFIAVGMLEDAGAHEDSLRILKKAAQNRPDKNRLIGLLLASQPEQIDLAMQFLQDARKTEPLAVVVQMINKLSKHVASENPHRDTLIEFATELLDDPVERRSIEWLLLGSLLEQLEKPRLAYQACEKSLNEIGNPSVAEHHLIWLRGGYLDNASDSITEIDSLIRRLGPREEFLDTKAVFLLLQGKLKESRELTEQITLNSPHKSSYRIHNRLAVASLLPKDKRAEVFDKLSLDELQNATPLIVDLIDKCLQGEN